jgi:hypothetical protein
MRASFESYVPQNTFVIKQALLSFIIYEIVYRYASYIEYGANTDIYKAINYV